MIRNRLGLLAGFGLLAGAVLLPGPAVAEVTFEFILEGGAAIAISDDGTVVAGNTQGDYEAFRWTAATGMVPLGRATGPVLGIGGGIPGISADGTRVCSTILGADSTYATQGLWTEGQGWQELMPPTPPDGGLLDNAYGSAWGLSGDGNTAVGLYWRPGATDGSAHASAWTQATGVVDLGSTGASTRADGANHDGSVIVGWDALGGPRRPAVWMDSTLTILCEPGGLGQAYGTNAAGTVISGYQRNFRTNKNEACLWRWNGTGWDAAEFLGVLPGTFIPGRSQAYAMSEDGSIVVGYNTFAGDPFVATGFLWTEATGIMDVEDFLADRGLLPAGFVIKTLRDVTPDGTVILGWGELADPPFTWKSFLIRLDAPVAVPALAAGAPEVSLEAWPNPMRGETTLTFTAPGASNSSVAIYDTTGRLVRQLVNGRLTPGRHEVTWDGRDAQGVRVATGVYFSRYVAGERTAGRKLVVVR